MTTTLDPSNKSSLIALSGGNLIAAGSGMTGSSNNKSVYSVDVVGVNLGYFEGTFTATDPTHQEMGFGIGNPTNGVNTWVGSSSSSCGELNFENIFLNGSNVGKSGSSGFSTGDTLDCAFNLTANLIWFRRNNGNWNNAAIGSQNPNGNVGGISITGIGASSVLKVMVTLGANADTLTMRFSSGSWTHTAPTGYGEIGTTANANATGSTISDAASIVAGSASSGVGVSGVTISDAASIVAGSATAGTGVGATGATITDTASIIAGAPSLSVAAPGTTITDTASIVAGSVQIDAPAQGATMTLVSSIIAGTASTGQVNANANGALITIPASIVAGHAYIGARQLTNQELRQLAARAVTSTTGDYNADFEALFDAAGISKALDFDGRLLSWINLKLVASYTDLPDAMTAFAIANGAGNWNSLGTFS